MPREDTQYKPGQSGNPSGRPKKGDTWADILEEVSEMEVSVDKKTGEKITFKKAAAIRAFQEAVKGNPLMFNAIMNRMSGYPKQSIEMEGRFATIQTDVSLTPEQEKEYSDKLDWIFKDKNNVDTGSDVGRQLHEDESSDDVDGPEIPPDA